MLLRVWRSTKSLCQRILHITSVTKFQDLKSLLFIFMAMMLNNQVIQTMYPVCTTIVKQNEFVDIKLVVDNPRSYFPQCELQADLAD